MEIAESFTEPIVSPFWLGLSQGTEESGFQSLVVCPKSPNLSQPCNTVCSIVPVHDIAPGGSPGSSWAISSSPVTSFGEKILALGLLIAAARSIGVVRLPMK